METTTMYVRHLRTYQASTDLTDDEIYQDVRRACRSVDYNEYVENGGELKYMQYLALFR